MQEEKTVEQEALTAGKNDYRLPALGTFSIHEITKSASRGLIVTSGDVYYTRS